MILITASGRLAHQPEIKVGRQTSFCEFRLLSTRFGRGEEHTEAVTFFCYGEDAERFCESTEKGQLIEASGTQETQRWNDASGERTAVKYKLTWWQGGPRPNRSRQSQAPAHQSRPAGGNRPAMQSSGHQPQAGRSREPDQSSGDGHPPGLI